MGNLKESGQYDNVSAHKCFALLCITVKHKHLSLFMTYNSSCYDYG